ncbi:hypothetical protein C4J95_4481 [Pseudomonas orientalis]|nr:hypothetical protein C4J95_4481 [Pseudomonas orientalis]
MNGEFFRSYCEKMPRFRAEVRSEHNGAATSNQCGRGLAPDGGVSASF